ncbi:MAG: RdgB/HAM1 family non-canonical purine NTP pyrophosphatase [Armatimonadetes bacterium]|nr:RdgB/HAM1 family non-canonical purine NTP pyrophosphatase [Armatimonadota bacterium]
MKRLVVATSNPHKVDEIRNILHGFPVDVVGLDKYPDTELPEETGQTFTENARLKACAAARKTGEICLADDSGICVDALGGAPGIHSNRFIGDHSTPEERNQALLRLLGRTPEDQRSARFACAACIAFPDGKTLEAFETCEGVITQRPSGTGGFGYDPIFFIPSLGKTLAEVPQEVKNSLSHRGKAMRAVIGKLLQQAAG